MPDGTSMLELRDVEVRFNLKRSGPFGAVPQLRAVAHLGHPQFAVRAPVERHRIAHLRLTRDELHREAFAHLEAAAAFLWLLRLRPAEIQQLFK